MARQDANRSTCTSIIVDLFELYDGVIVYNITLWIINWSWQVEDCHEIHTCVETVSSLWCRPFHDTITYVVHRKEEVQFEVIGSICELKMLNAESLGRKKGSYNDTCLNFLLVKYHHDVPKDINGVEIWDNLLWKVRFGVIANLNHHQSQYQVLLSTTGNRARLYLSTLIQDNT